MNSTGYDEENDGYDPCESCDGCSLCDGCVEILEGIIEEAERRGRRK